jgi:hypothetical protein
VSHLTKLSALAIAVATAFVVALVAAESPTTLPTQAEIDELEQRRDHFRIVGVVEFDGERIAYDEIIQVRIDVHFESDLGKLRGDVRQPVSRSWVVRPVQSGGALAMEVPNASRLWADLKGYLPPNRNWSPAYIARYLRPPPDVLPEFYWFNDLRNPTIAEAYVSESYFAQPFARLKILEPIRLEYVPDSPEARTAAIRQMKEEPRFDYVKGRVPHGHGWWKAVILLSVTKDQWRRSPEIVAAVARLKTDSPSLLQVKTPLSEFFPSWGGEHHRRYGVPRPRQYGSDPYHPSGLVVEEFGVRYVDQAIPTMCTNTGTKTIPVCTPVLNRNGYIMFYDGMSTSRGRLIDINSTELLIKRASVIYVPQTSTIYYVIGDILSQVIQQTSPSLRS